MNNQDLEPLPDANRFDALKPGDNLIWHHFRADGDTKARGVLAIWFPVVQDQ